MFSFENMLNIAGSSTPCVPSSSGSSSPSKISSVGSEYLPSGNGANGKQIKKESSTVQCPSNSLAKHSLPLKKIKQEFVPPRKSKTETEEKSQMLA